MPSTARIPHLALPFGALGAAVGWLSTSLLRNPLVQTADALDVWLAALGGAVVAAAVGAGLTRWARRDVDFFRPPHPAAKWVWLTLSQVLGGAAIGALVGASTGYEGGATTGLTCGALAAVAAVPLSATVMSAALRAGRARLGSIVAGADRREVWAILAAAAAFASLAALPAWPAAAAGWVPAPWLALGIVFASVAATGATLRADHAARERVAAATARVEERDGERAAAVDVPRLDLGLGDELHAQVAPGAATYRAQAQDLALILGSPDEARRALRRAVVRGCALLGFTLLVAAAHAAAFTWRAEVAFGRALCERKLVFVGCQQAAAALERGDADDPRILEMLERACTGHVEASCVHLAEVFLAHADAGRREPVLEALSEGCGQGMPKSCAAAADVSLAAGDRARANRLLERACQDGDRASCSAKDEWVGRCCMALMDRGEPFKSAGQACTESRAQNVSSVVVLAKMAAMLDANQLPKECK